MRRKYIFLLLTTALIVSNTGLAGKAAAPNTISLSGSPYGALRPPLLLADRIEEKDRIIYGTDPEMDRLADEEAREEQEKQAQSWKMLQQMNLYQSPGSQPPPLPAPNPPKK